MKPKHLLCKVISILILITFLFQQTAFGNIPTQTISSTLATGNIVPGQKPTEDEAAIEFVRVSIQRLRMHGVEPLQIRPRIDAMLREGDDPLSFRIGRIVYLVDKGLFAVSLTPSGDTVYINQDNEIVDASGQPIATGAAREDEDLAQADFDAPGEPGGRELGYATFTVLGNPAQINIGNIREIHGVIDTAIEPYFPEDSDALPDPEKAVCVTERGSRELVDRIRQLLNISGFKGTRLYAIFENLIANPSGNSRIATLTTNGKPIGEVDISALDAASVEEIARNSGYSLSSKDKLRILGHASDRGPTIADAGNIDENAMRIIFELLRYMGVDKKVVSQFNLLIRNNLSNAWTLADEINNQVDNNWDKRTNRRPANLLAKLKTRQIAMATVAAPNALALLAQDTELMAEINTFFGGTPEPTDPDVFEDIVAAEAALAPVLSDEAAMPQAIARLQGLGVDKDTATRWVMRVNAGPVDAGDREDLAQADFDTPAEPTGRKDAGAVQPFLAMDPRSGQYYTYGTYAEHDVLLDQDDRGRAVVIRAGVTVDPAAAKRAFSRAHDELAELMGLRLSVFTGRPKGSEAQLKRFYAKFREFVYLHEVGHRIAAMTINLIYGDRLTPEVKEAFATLFARWALGATREIPGTDPQAEAYLMVCEVAGKYKDSPPANAPDEVKEKWPAIVALFNDLFLSNHTGYITLQSDNDRSLIDRLAEAGIIRDGEATHLQDLQFAVNGTTIEDLQTSERLKRALASAQNRGELKLMAIPITLECEVPEACARRLDAILAPQREGEDTAITKARKKLESGLQVKLGNRIYALKREGEIIVREQKDDVLATGSAMFDSIFDLGDNPFPDWAPKEGEGDLAFAADGGVAKSASELGHEISADLPPGGPGQAAAFALANLGKRVRAKFTFGNDANGIALKRRMEQSGMDVSGVALVDGKATARTFVVENKQGRKFLHEIGADNELSAADLTPDDYKVEVFYVGGAALTPKLMRELPDVFQRAKHEGAITVMDTVADRLGLWRELEGTGAAREICKNLDVLTISAGEVAQYTSETAPEAIIDHFLKMGVKTVIYKMGDKGCMVGSKGSPIFADTVVDGQFVTVQMPVYKYPAGFKVHHTGMGDAFSGGVAAAILDDRTLGASTAYATAVASKAGEQEAGGGDIGPEKAKGASNRFDEVLTQDNVMGAVERINTSEAAPATFLSDEQVLDLREFVIDELRRGSRDIVLLSWKVSQRLTRMKRIKEANAESMQEALVLLESWIKDNPTVDKVASLQSKGTSSGKQMTRPAHLKDLTPAEKSLLALIMHGPAEYSQRQAWAASLANTISAEAGKLKEGQRIYVPIDTGIGNMGPDLAWGLRTVMVEKGLADKVVIIAGTGSELADAVATALRENPDAIVRGVISTRDQQQYQDRFGRETRMKLVLVDDSAVPNTDTANLHYIPILPMIEAALTGELTPIPYARAAQSEAGSIFANIITLQLPRAEDAIPTQEELRSRLQEDITFLRKA